MCTEAAARVGYRARQKNKLQSTLMSLRGILWLSCAEQKHGNAHRQPHSTFTCTAGASLPDASPAVVDCRRVLVAGTFMLAPPATTAMLRQSRPKPSGLTRRAIFRDTSAALATCLAYSSQAALSQLRFGRDLDESSALGPCRSRSLRSQPTFLSCCRPAFANASHHHHAARPL